MGANDTNMATRQANRTGTRPGTAPIRTAFTIDRMSGPALLASGIVKLEQARLAPKHTFKPCRGEIPGVVYVVQAPPSMPVKIGFTRAKLIAHRLTGIQTGNPYKLKIIARAPCLPADERKIHRMLKADRLTGEWFEWSPRVQALVAALSLGVEAALQELAA